MGKFKGIIVFTDKILHGVTGCLSWLPGLVTRISIGLMFIGTGWGKIHNISKVIGFFTDLGLPAPSFQAHLVAVTELSCGILVLIGFLTRLASIPLSIIMIVALLTAKKADIGSFDDLVGTIEYFYLLALVWLVFCGAGAISLDRVLGRFYFKKKK